MLLRKIVKRIQEYVYKPLLLWYLRKDRKVHTQGLTIIVKKGVFHPGLFYSTSILLKFLKTQHLQQKTLLEPGCGTGMISVWAAKRGALVTALDINPAAVANTLLNSKLNNQQINILASDLFSKLVPKTYDFILINPPYYARRPETFADFAWYCGTDFEYFRELFNTLPSFYNSGSMVMMVLSEDCDVSVISKIAEINGQQLQLFSVSRSLFETNYLYRINIKSNDRQDN